LRCGAENAKPVAASIDTSPGQQETWEAAEAPEAMAAEEAEAPQISGAMEEVAAAEMEVQQMAVAVQRLPILEHQRHGSASLISHVPAPAFSAP